jgi:hypothetical protein
LLIVVIIFANEESIIIEEQNKTKKKRENREGACLAPWKVPPQNAEQKIKEKRKKKVFILKLFDGSQSDRESDRGAPCARCHGHMPDTTNLGDYEKYVSN